MRSRFDSLADSCVDSCVDFGGRLSATFLLCLVFSAFLLVPSVWSQSASPLGEGDAPETLSSHGDWSVQCQNVVAAEGSARERQCGIIQTAFHERRENVGLTIVVVREREEGEILDMMQVRTPVGVYLPLGVALEIDGTPVGRVPYTRCLPGLCMAFAEATEATVEKMRKGVKANFIIYEGPGLGVTVPVSLIGFSAAYDALAAL